MSIYSPIWNEIKTKGYAEITVSKAHARTVECGVKRVKTAENVSRRLAGLVGWSKLVITRTELSATHLRLRMELLYLTAL